MTRPAIQGLYSCDKAHYVTHKKPSNDMCVAGSWIANVTISAKGFLLSDEEFETYLKEKLSFLDMVVRGERESRLAAEDESNEE